MTALFAASRPTRRDMARHPLRILAALLLIALPVFILSWMLTNSYAEESAVRSHEGRTAAQWFGGSCVQNITASGANCTRPASSDDHSLQELLDAHLPAGFHSELSVSAWGTASHGKHRSFFSVQQRADGRTPPPGEVWLTTSVAQELRAEVGDTITFQPQESGESVELTVAGTLPGYAGLVAEPGLVAPEELRTTTEGTVDASWTITGPEKFTWDDVLALNAVGFTVISQDVLDNPPPPEAVDEQFRGDRATDYPMREEWSFRVVTAAGLLTLGLLAMLVISPVFTIATSRMARIFALMSSQGATPWHIRLAVLTYGLITGLIGATGGVILGVGAAAVSWSLRFPEWPFAIPWPGLLAVWAMAIVGATFSSLLPAWVASRASISAGVQGASPDRLLRWRPWMALGPAGLALLALVMLGLWMFIDPATRYFWSSLPALALVVLLAGSAPAVVWALGHLGKRAPLPLRLALRDASRQSLRSVPAVAAIMTVLAISIGIQVDQTSGQAREQALFDTVYQGQSVFVEPEMAPEVAPDAAAIEDIVTTVQSLLGVSERIDLRGVRYPSGDSGYHEIDYGMERCDEENTNEECLPRKDYVSGPLERADASLLEATPEALGLLHLDDAARTRAFNALTTPGILAPVGTVESELSVREVIWDSNLEDTRVLAEAVLPVIPVLPDLSQATLITPSGLAELGVQTEYIGTVLVPAMPLHYGAQEDLRARAAEETVGTALSISPTEWLPAWWPAAIAGILGAGVVIVVTLVLALSWQSSRRQFALLDAIGAPPELPSRVSGAFAGLLALVGSAGGVIFGHLAAFLLTSRTRTLDSGLVMETGTLDYFTTDWQVLFILLIVTPVACWAIGSLLHRNRGELEYRET